MLLDEHTVALGPKTAAKVLEITARIVVDISGEEKKKLTVEQLLGLFAQASGSEFTNDRTILA